MNRADDLVRGLLSAGVDTCFTNPGTSEMHIVAALDRARSMKCVLCLFEGVATGAADGYARMAGKPACTLLHLGPGLANGLANLHNAGRANVPIVNIVGQHPAYHLRFDPPLASDIEGIARPYSKWLRTSQASESVSRDVAEAVSAARKAPGQIATLVVPADIAWGELSAGSHLPDVCPRSDVKMPASEKIERVASMLRSDLPTAILLAGSGLYGRGLIAAGRIAAATKTRLLAPYAFTRMERGVGRPYVERVNYVHEQAVEQLKGFRQMILVGTSAPVSYFAYPGKKSEFTPPECEIFTLATESEDCTGALEAVAEILSAPKSHLSDNPPTTNTPTSGEISQQGIGAAIGALLPDNAIVIDESMTSGRGLMAATRGSAPHDWLANTGGSIGIAMPLAVGAAIASPNRRVLCLSADGSGMYTVQALWTMARENLNITTVIFANRAYAVLKREFAGLGVGEPGSTAASLFDIGHPELDWVAIAKGMGVPGTRVTTMERLRVALKEGFEGDGPGLVEVVL